MSRTDQALQILAEQLDIDIDELEDDDTEFSALGLDGRLGPSIVRRITEKTGLKLSDDVFDTCPDVGGFKQHIKSLSGIPAESTTTPANNSNLETDKKKKPTVLSVRIQGNPEKASKTIFLLPDGSGSAMAYARIAGLPPDTCLYALNSPFLRDAAAYTCSIPQIATIWAEEVQRLQPHGPYILGGWSAGGYYAYEVMRHLQRRGETVRKMIMIDSPCRTHFEALPLEVVVHLSSHDLMGTWGGGPGGASASASSKKATPDWIVDHFDATLRAVREYTPTPLDDDDAACRPELFVIWASEPLLGPEAAARTGLDLGVRVSRFLLAARDDFGPNGWEGLFPASSVAIAKMPGNHFNIIHPPQVGHLGRLLGEVAAENTDGWHVFRRASSS